MLKQTVAALILINFAKGLLTVSTDNVKVYLDRIIRGDDVSISNHPYQASLQYKDKHTCGGSLYNSQIVVTAAHCVNNYMSNDIPYLSIVLGTSTWASGGVKIPVKSFAIHHDFNSFSLNYDLALIKLKSPVTFSNSIQPISLSTKTPASGAQVFVTGWGVLDNMDVKPSSYLQGAQLTFIPRAACGASPNKYDSTLISPNMICAGIAGKGACRGDSGGPLIDLATKSLLGVVSWGFNCATSGYPTVYTSVPALANWIRSSEEV